MISDERLNFKLKNPDICTPDEIEMAKELLAHRKAWSEPVAYLTVRLPGVKGFGNARRIVDAKIYDPTKEGYWSPGARELHSIQPLYCKPSSK